MKDKEIKDLVFDVKMLNLCAWITMIITYVTPYRINNQGLNLYGYPFAFFTVHPLSTSTIPLMGGSLYPLRFFIDLYIIYFLLKILKRVYYRFTRKRKTV